LLRGFLAGPYAVGDADAAVAVAGEGESWQLLAQALDAVEPFQMADAVLGHGGLPFVNAGKERSGAEADDLLQFRAHNRDDGLVGKLPYIFGTRSGEEATEKSAIFGSAVRKFVVDECRGEQAFAFTARDEKSKTGRQRLADLAIVAEADGDGRAVADGGKFGGKLGTAGGEKLGCGKGGKGKNYGVEAIGFRCRDDVPSPGLVLNRLHRRVGY